MSGPRPELRAPVELSPELVLFDQGRYLDAWHSFQARRPGLRLAAAADLVLLGRLSSRVVAEATHLWSVRRLLALHPDHPAAWRMRVYHMMERRQGVRAWQLVRSTDRVPGADDWEAAQWLGTRAMVLVQFRDFRGAHAAVDQAMELAPDDPWVQDERAAVWFAQDRRAEAVELMTRVCAAHPLEYGPQHRLAFYLHEESRAAEAIVQVERAIERFQAPPLLLERARYAWEQDDLVGARRWYERLVARFPLASRRLHRHVCASLARVCHQLGDAAAAAAWARWGGPALAELERRAAAAGGARVVLPVPYVKQDHVTCAPATTTAILRSFGVEADPRLLAEVMTYDGTPDFKRRAWCRAQGLVFREFQWRADTARTLIDRGVPFSLATRFPLGAHLQAVVGYDQGAGTWVVREPGMHVRPEFSEAEMDGMAAARGLPCDLVLPAAAAARIADLELPLEAESTALTDLRQALHEHRLEVALKCLRRLEPLGTHPLRFEAQVSLWSYLRDSHAWVASARAVVALHPGDDWLMDQLAVALEVAGRHGELVAFLEQAVAAPGAHPVLLLRLADALRLRASTRPRALALAWRVLRRMPFQAAAVRLLADILWDDPPTRPLALDLYCLASCSSPHDEALADSMFLAARMLGQPEAGIEFLRRRCEDLLDKSGAPAVTLAHALARLFRTGEAVEVMSAALARHDEAWLRRSLVDLLIGAGRRAEAREVLDAGLGRMPRSDHALLAARLEELAADLHTALETLDGALLHNPSDERIHSMRLRLLMALDGQDAVQAEAHALARAHPEHGPLLRLIVGQLRATGDLTGAEALLRARLAAQPNEEWTGYALAQLSVDAGRPAEGVALCQRFLAEVPQHSGFWTLLGVARMALGEREAAAEAFRAALHIDVDHGFVCSRLLSLAGSAAEGQDVLRCFATELRAQGPGTEALDVYLSAAVGELPDAEWQQLLRDLEHEHPTDPRPGEAHATVLLRQRRFDAAAEIAAALAEVFPYRVEPLVLEARARRALGDVGSARGLLTRAADMDPGRVDLGLEAAEVQEEAGALGVAEAAYRRLVAAQPLEAAPWGYLADLLWRTQRPDEALAAMARALALMPEYPWAMNTLLRWLYQHRGPGAALERARQFVRQLPRAASAHAALAKVLRQADDPEGALLAWQDALRCEPRNLEAFEAAIALLVELGRLDQARALHAQGSQHIGAASRLVVIGLRLRWVAGERDAAIAGLRAHLAQDADDERGWRELLAWLEETGRHAELAALYAEPPAVMAGQAMFWGSVADGLVAVGRRQDALAALERALALAPGYHWARARRSDLLAELDPARDRAEWDRCPVPLDQLDPACLAGAARAAASDPRLLACLGAFFVAAEGRPEPALVRLLHTALARRDPTARSAILDQLLRSELPGVNAAVAFLGAHDQADAALLAGLEHLRQRSAWPELASVLRYLSGRPLAATAGAWVVRTLRPPVVDAQLWGSAGFLLAGLGRSQDVVALMFADHRRADAQPWMVANLSDGLVALDDLPRIEAVAQHGLTLPRSHAYWWFRVALAYVRCRQGRDAEARELARMPALGLDGPEVECALLNLVLTLRGTVGRRARARQLRSLWPALYRDASARVRRDPGFDPWRSGVFRLFVKEARRLTWSWRAVLLGWGAKGRARSAPD